MADKDLDSLPSFKRDAGGMLSRTERHISKSALDASERAKPTDPGDAKFFGQHCSHGSHGSHGSW